MESIPLFTGFIINVLCDLTFLSLLNPYLDFDAKIIFPQFDTRISPFCIIPPVMRMINIPNCEVYTDFATKPDFLHHNPILNFRLV